MKSAIERFCRVASREELLPVGHLLAGQTPDVPPHVKQGLQDVLQAVPVSDYSPLDHHSGAFQKLAVSPFLLCMSPKHAHLFAWSDRMSDGNFVTILVRLLNASLCA